MSTETDNNILTPSFPSGTAAFTRSPTPNGSGSLQTLPSISESESDRSGSLQTLPSISESDSDGSDLLQPLPSISESNGSESTQPTDLMDKMAKSLLNFIVWCGAIIIRVTSETFRVLYKLISDSLHVLSKIIEDAIVDIPIVVSYKRTKQLYYENNESVKQYVHMFDCISAVIITLFIGLYIWHILTV